MLSVKRIETDKRNSKEARGVLTRSTDTGKWAMQETALNTALELMQRDLDPKNIETHGRRLKQLVQSLEPAHQDFTRRKPLNNDPEPGKTDVLEIKSKVTKALEEQMMKLQGHQASTIMTKGAELMQKIKPPAIPRKSEDYQELLRL